MSWVGGGKGCVCSTPYLDLCSWLQASRLKTSPPDVKFWFNSVRFDNSVNQGDEPTCPFLGHRSSSDSCVQIFKVQVLFVDGGYLGALSFHCLQSFW